MERIKSALLATALALYNAGVFCALNVLLWRNNAWNKKKWTMPVLKKNESTQMLRAASFESQGLTVVEEGCGTCRK